MPTKGEKDSVTGMDTTGHEWDGIRELDTPLPAWWKWVFYASVVWAIGYWIAMPSWPWPGGAAPGLLGYSQRQVVAESLAEARAGQSAWRDRIATASLDEIRGDAQLRAFAISAGRSAFAVNCSQCHGLGAAGSKGYPNLNDDEWLWGGTLENIHRTIAYGIRSDHPDTRSGEMLAFGDQGVLGREDIAAAVDHVLSLGAAAGGPSARGKEVFDANCVACHGADGRGRADLGAPDLTNRLWLYGGDRQSIADSITHGRAGVMPAWDGRIDAVVIKELAIFVHALGGGQ
ncbi:MAG: cytochrome-c oxidase, cbb3-type subunit III [Alphaproteobacteria bacterium]